MPLSVINNMEADQVSELCDIGTHISNATNKRKGKKRPVPKDVLAASNIAESTAVSIEAVEKVGHTSVFACPDCGGNLWSIEGDVLNRYRCHIGHAYTERDLVIKQAESASATLWLALRMTEERKHLLKEMEADSRKKDYNSMLARHTEKRDHMERHIEKLKEILFDLQSYDTT